MPLKSEPENFPSFMLISMSYIAAIVTPTRRFCGRANRASEHACAIAAFYLFCSSIYYPLGHNGFSITNCLLAKFLLPSNACSRRWAILRLFHL